MYLWFELVCVDTFVVGLQFVWVVCCLLGAFAWLVCDCLLVCGLWVRDCLDGGLVADDVV